MEKLYSIFQSNPAAAFAPAIVLVILTLAWAIRQSSFRSR
jgi:hypothetical protein